MYARRAASPPPQMKPPDLFQPWRLYGYVRHQMSTNISTGNCLRHFESSHVTNSCSHSRHVATWLITATTRWYDVHDDEDDVDDTDWRWWSWSAKLGLRRRGGANEAVAVLHQVLHARDDVRVPGHNHNPKKKRSVEGRLSTTNDKGRILTHIYV